ncbi:MAG TPA: carboxylating nicotinate-nucleotide diphosphorylase [Catalimonadaceae bacterium]|nr:carboxylating nicotinate-nucleotide diphosphorylase [Catalimonadaceae bacterium]
MTNNTLAYLTPERLNHFISEALAEDIGPGDYSSLSSVGENVESSALLHVKDAGILAGMELAKMIFEKVDASLVFEPILSDGDKVKVGDKAFSVSGKARSILSAERLVLNCLQRMSGIATKTNALTRLISHTKTKLLDTRKTNPNSRIIEKWAVAIGGGQNHRYALYDMIMLKDNHIDFAGGIPNALDAARNYLKANNLALKIEVETRNLNEVLQVLAHGGADIIMLDNFSLEDLHTAVGAIDGRLPVEASGNITEATITSVAETGVDFISVGALTHSYKSMDLSLKAVR